MDEHFGVERLLALRRLTRAMADTLRDELRDTLTTLAPLLRPRAVLGDFVQGAGKDAVRGADKAWKELGTLHDQVTRKAPFDLARELKPPLDIPGTALEMSPVEYVHAARGSGEKRITVTKPFEWVISYSAHGPGRLRELLADKNREGSELQRVVTTALVLHVVVTNQKGVRRVLEGLRFPFVSRRLPEFGDLPITIVASTVPTTRPPDDVIIQSTEISGSNLFQEVVDVDGLTRLPDPFRERLLAVVREHGAELLPS